MTWKCERTARRILLIGGSVEEGVAASNYMRGTAQRMLSSEGRHDSTSVNVLLDTLSRLLMIRGAFWTNRREDQKLQHESLTSANARNV